MSLVTWPRLPGPGRPSNILTPAGLAERKGRAGSADMLQRAINALAPKLYVSRDLVDAQPLAQCLVLGGQTCCSAQAHGFWALDLRPCSCL